MRKWNRLICFAAVLALALSLAAPALAATYKYVETTGSVNIRTGPGLSYATLSSASSGSTFDYLGKTTYDNRDVAWYKISCTKGNGWVSSTYARLVGSKPEPKSGKRVVATGSVNIRTGPGLGYSTVSSAEDGSSFPYLNKTSRDSRGVAWYKVSCAKGNGWISSTYAYLSTSYDPKPVYGDRVVTTGSVNIRTGPALWYDALSTAEEGASFTYLDKTSFDSRDVAWYKIRCAAGTGWISSTYAYLDSGDYPVYDAYVELTASSNVRSGPGLGYAILTAAQEGDWLEYLNRTRYDDRGVAWYRVSCGGETGWVSSAYATLYD